MKRRSVTRGTLYGTTAAMFSTMLQLSTFALNANIQFSDPSAKVGEGFTVSMHVQGDSVVSNMDTVLSYGNEKIEFISGDSASGSDGELTVKSSGGEGKSNIYYSLRFKTLRDGSAAVQVKSAKSVDNNQGATIAHQGSAVITIAAADATAGSSAAETAATPTEVTGPPNNLSLNPDTLMPAFSVGNTVYTAVVGEEVICIATNAVPATEGAKVSVTGNENLKLGENKIEVNVLGSDNSAPGIYAIIAAKQQGATPETASIEDSTHVTTGTISYTIADNFDQALSPAGYESESFTYGDQMIQTGKGSDKHLHLIYLLADDGSGNLYFYDDMSRIWSPYAQVGATVKAVSVVPLPEGVAVPEGFLVKRATLSGKTVDGYIGQKDQGQNYCVFYGMNSRGEKRFCRFDLQEKTLQRYFSGDGAGQNTAEQLRAQYKVSYRKTVGFTCALMLAIGAAIYAFPCGARRKSPELAERERRRTERKAAYVAEELLQHQEQEVPQKIISEEVESHTGEVLAGAAEQTTEAEEPSPQQPEEIVLADDQVTVVPPENTVADSMADDLGVIRVLPQPDMSEHVRETSEEARNMTDTITAQAQAVNGRKNTSGDEVFEDIDPRSLERRAGRLRSAVCTVLLSRRGSD